MKIRLMDLDLNRIRQIADRHESKLERLDALTEIYRPVLDSLPLQQAKIIVSMARHGKPARVCEIAKFAGLWQQNKTSAQLSRMVNEGIIIKQGRLYQINNQYPYFERYIQARCLRQ